MAWRAGATADNVGVILVLEHQDDDVPLGWRRRGDAQWPAELARSRRAERTALPPETVIIANDTSRAG